MWQAAMLAAVVVSAPAPLPAGTRLCLWSLSTGELLQHSTDPPLRTRFGPQLPNVTGALLKPPLAGLCTWRPEMSAWQDRIVLAGDWTSPGCSIEERARILTDAGATAVIFMGTEGLPLDWDGSAYEGIRIPSVVIGASRYTRIAEAIDTSATDMSTFLSDARPAADIMIWLAPNDTPLMHEPSFLAFDRALQALFFLAAASNVALALYQLARFLMAAKRLAASSNKLQAGSAIKVICLELVSALAMIVFIIDGPGMEHTRPVVLPWLAHRLALAVQTEAHMLALLVSSTHLQRIRSRVQNTRPQRSVESSGENFRESINVSDEDTKCCQVASCYHGFVVGSILMLVVVDLFIAVCTGMYIVPDFFVTYIVATYIIFVNTFIGGWFIWQAHVISRMLKRVASSNHSNRRMTRLSRNTMRFGALTVFTAVVSVIVEVIIRPMILSEGGWAYWCTMVPLWAVMEGSLLLATTIQILAFQPPSDDLKRRASLPRNFRDSRLGRSEGTASLRSSKCSNMSDQERQSPELRVSGSSPEDGALHDHSGQKA